VRVALVSRELYPYVGGGIAPIVAAAARLLSQVAEVTLVTSASNREAHERLAAAGDPRLPPANVEIVWVEEPQEGQLGAYLSYMHHYSARAYQALARHYGDRGPDVIEFCDYLGEGLVTMQARHTGAPWLERTLVCVRLHTTAELANVLDAYLPDDMGSTAVYEAERFTLRHADRILWSGGDVLETYRRYYGAVAQPVRIPDAFLAEIEPEDGDGVLPVAGGPMRFLYLGRMERRKGVQNLMRAATSLARDDWTLTLLGGDTQTGAMGSSLWEQLAMMADEDPRIRMLSHVPRAEVEAHLRNAHALVVPSLWECWPNTAREALMLNRPLLATRVGGLCELAQPGRSGWLVPELTPEAIGEAMSERLDDFEGTAELTAHGRPRDVFDELTDPEALLRRYQELAADVGTLPARRRERRPLVSIVVPYFKLEKLVAATLRSALDQTYPNVEVVLVVDGSLREQDGAILDLAEKLGVTVAVQPNAGLGAARNFGVSQSRGAYVLPLDADDLIEPTFVERCVDALERDPELAYVTTWVEYMTSDGTRMVNEDGGYMPLGNWTRLIERNNVGGTCSAVFRRSLFDAGFRYSEELTSYEDWLHYLDLHRAGHHGGVIPERLFRYRVREDSMMREVGAPSLQRIAAEVRAHSRIRDVQWVAGDDVVPVPAPTLP
jgi:glycogen(starch) synthase